MNNLNDITTMKDKIPESKPKYSCGLLGLGVCKDAGKKDICYKANSRDCERYKLIMDKKQ